MWAYRALFSHFWVTFGFFLCSCKIRSTPTSQDYPLLTMRDLRGVADLHLLAKLESLFGLVDVSNILYFVWSGEGKESPRRREEGWSVSYWKSQEGGVSQERGGGPKGREGVCGAFGWGGGAKFPTRLATTIVCASFFLFCPVHPTFPKQFSSPKISSFWEPQIRRVKSTPDPNTSGKYPRYILPFLSRYFCKSMRFSWQKIVYTPPIVSRYGSHLYRDTFAEVLGTGVVGTPPTQLPSSFSSLS